MIEHNLKLINVFSTENELYSNRRLALEIKY